MIGGILIRVLVLGAGTGPVLRNKGKFTSRVDNFKPAIPKPHFSWLDTSLPWRFFQHQAFVSLKLMILIMFQVRRTKINFSLTLFQPIIYHWSLLWVRFRLLIRWFFQYQFSCFYWYVKFNSKNVNAVSISCPKHKT